MADQFPETQKTVTPEGDHTNHQPNSTVYANFTPDTEQMLHQEVSHVHSEDGNVVKRLDQSREPPERLHYSHSSSLANRVVDSEVDNPNSNPETEVSTKIYEPNLPSKTRAWISLVLILVCYVGSFIALIPLSTQYFTFRIGRDKYNVSVNVVNHGSKCDNRSEAEKELNNNIQSDTANLLLKATIAGGIPALVACLFIGSYSDFIGRRPLMIGSLVGLLMRIVSLCVVIETDVSLNLYIGGSAIDGVFGSFYSVTLAATAVVSDITPNAQNRAMKFAIVEGIVLVAGALSQLGVGFMIKDVGFFYPAMVALCLAVLALVTAIFGMPETLQDKSGREFKWNPATHMRKVFGFYLTEGTRIRRVHFVVGLAIFTFFNLTNMGRLSVETLFVLNAPICWNPIDIGIFASTRLIAMSLAAVLILKLFGKRCTLEVIGMVAITSGIAGFIMEGFANNTTSMYLAALVALLFNTVLPIPRALLSEIASPMEQGALFSSLSAFEVIASLVSSTLYTLIYKATLNVFQGAVFIVMAGLGCVTFLLFLAYRLLRAKYPCVTTEYKVLAPDIVTSNYRDTSKTKVPQANEETVEDENESSPLLTPC